MQLTLMDNCFKSLDIRLKKVEFFCIGMKANLWGHKNRTQRHCYFEGWKVHCSYLYDGNAMLSSFHGVLGSTQVESKIFQPSETFQVKEKLSQDLTNFPFQRSKDSVLLAHYIPVYVMLPLDTILMDNELLNVDLLHANFRALKAAHVDGLMVDVWWGIVERGGPKQYDWSAYRLLFQLVQSYGFKLQAIMSFHQCGSNSGDSCYIPLPEWVRKEGESNPDIYFTNRDSKRNEEYLSFGIDSEPALNGRTAVEAYRDFMKSFKENMSDFLEAEIITEIEVGLGPCGELRYPSFSNSQGWRFPGIGEFQCYDKYLLSDLKETAKSIGQSEWGSSGPEDAGHYNDWPQATGFFRNHGAFTTDYGRFFLEWYSGILLKHGDTILQAAAETFEGYKVRLAAKIAGIHWWYNSVNHAAELAAGYYNLRERDGYKPVAKMLARHRAILNFTCIEMRDEDHYWKARCGPEGLVKQVLNAGWNEGIDVSCENALPRFDRGAFDQILLNARPDGISSENLPEKRVFSFTYLRLGQDLMREDHWREFVSFVRQMHAGLDYHPEPEKYFQPRVPLELSKSLEAFVEEPVVPVASVPLDQYHVPLAHQRTQEPFFSQDAPGGGLGAQVEEPVVPLDQYHVPLALQKTKETFFSQDAPGRGLGAQVEDSSVPFPLNLIAWLWSGMRPVKQSMQSLEDLSVRDDRTCDEDLPEFFL